MKTTSNATLRCLRGDLKHQVATVRERGIGVIHIDTPGNRIKVTGGTRKIKRLCKQHPGFHIVEIEENEREPLCCLPDGDHTEDDYDD